MRLTRRIACVLVSVVSLACTAGCGSGNKAEESLTSDVVRSYAGITCTWPADLSEGAAECRLANGGGFATAVAHRFVIVRNFETRKIVFTRNQPEDSAGYERSADKRIFHRETHREIACYWSRAGGGAAFCSRADNHGYSVGINPVAALVLTEKGKIAFLKNHP